MSVAAPAPASTAGAEPEDHCHNCPVHDPMSRQPCNCGAYEPEPPPICQACGVESDEIDEYTGVPGWVCKACHREWLTGQREGTQW